LCLEGNEVRYRPPDGSAAIEPHAKRDRIQSVRVRFPYPQDKSHQRYGLAVWRGAKRTFNLAGCPSRRECAGAAIAGEHLPNYENQSLLRAFRPALLGLGLLSLVLNLLMLTGALFMLEVYDRVLPSRSVPTLVGLALLAGLLFSFQAGLDLIRSRIFVRIAGSIDDLLSRKVFTAIARQPLHTPDASGLQPLRDLDQMKSFLASGGPVALFDLPWIPLYLAICFAFHLWIGVTATTGALVLVALTLAAEMRTRLPIREAARHGVMRNRLAEAARRNAEVLHAMGMRGQLAAIWERSNAAHLAEQERANDVGSGLSALSKVLRIALQSAVLGVGAYLVIHAEATAGIIIAASILSARALAPVDLAIANWKHFQAARQSARRLAEALGRMPEAEREALTLPAPRASLAVANIAVAAPGDRKLILQDLSFSVPAGSALGIIGPSASGKSTLARALVGIWPTPRGSVRLDGAALDQWDDGSLGGHIGYLPQDVELFDGSVAENICRFAPDASAEATIAAAAAAGMHEMILQLPKGYDTLLGEGSSVLSAGQRQRIALARALFGDPFLVVLDEPNSNLDAAGEEALTHAIMRVRRRGGIAVVVAHRPNALASVDLVLVLAEGRAQAFGPKDEVLQKVLRPAAVPARMAAVT
jgi:PrtD family type I secretion system ABC transporter